jgi:uncharacterized membrane protein YkvA (DUF1232 family)
MLRGILDQIRLTWRLMRDSRVPLWAKIIPVASILYVLSPIDLIPDFIIGLGQLDDLTILIGGMRLFESLTPGYIVDEHREFLSRRDRPLDVVDAPSYRVIEKDKRE